jgi:hypothetical protein
MKGPAALVTHWRELAARFARYGQPGAELLGVCAAELEAAIAEGELEAISLREAAAESGLSYSALEKAIRGGRLPNAGRPGAPLIRRADLPRKMVRAQGPSLAEQVQRKRLAR